jgi:hypothetical protein
MKTLNDVKQDMSDLYEAVLMGTCDLKLAAELANISGKFLKAEQLQLARDIFLNVSRPQPLTVIQPKE